ncbi:YegP family protein [Dyadobacter linearis]
MLRSSNSDVIGTSELYRTADGLMAVIESVMENGRSEC